MKLHWKVFTALVASIIVGGLLQVSREYFPSPEVESMVLGSCRFIGKIFFNALKMIVVPLIISSVICGMLGLGKEQNFQRLGMKTLTYYFTSGFLAIMLGVLLVNVIRPGVVDRETALSLLVQAQNPEDFVSHVKSHQDVNWGQMIADLIPSNIIAAAGDNGQLLGVIIFSIIFGFFISRLPQRYRQIQRQFWISTMEVMTHITDFIIAFSPYGVFGLVTPVVAETGLEAARPIAWFFITVLLGLFLHTFVVLPVIMRIFGVDPVKHHRAVFPAILTAVSISSSVSALPVTMETVERRAGISNRVASFVLPLGATVNMDGTALYECTVVLFIGQFYGVISGEHLTWGVQMLVVAMALLTSVGVAGIPSASLVSIAVILSKIGLPIESIGIVMVVDRVLDMIRTGVNVFSDTCGAAIIAKSEGEVLEYTEDFCRREEELL